MRWARSSRPRWRSPSTSTTRDRCGSRRAPRPGSSPSVSPSIRSTAMPCSGKRPICRCSTSIVPMSAPERSSCAGGCSHPAPSPGDRARRYSSSSSAGRTSPGEAMSFKSTICTSRSAPQARCATTVFSDTRKRALRARAASSPALAVGLALVCVAGCSEVRGRKKIQEANELYKRGRYQEAVAAFEAAEALVPNLPTLWLNKGYTCRQLIAPGGHDPESRRAADCALAAFRKLHELSPNDPRADQLTVQTWFDVHDFE